MAQFMLLLHDTPTDYMGLSPEELQACIGKYNAWAGKLGQAGKLLGGEKLKDEGGKHLSLKNGKLAITDGPFAETKEVVGGYFTIEAADYAEACRLASDCPSLEYGGRVEVREVDHLEDAPQS